MSENSISTIETASDGIIKLAGRLLVATVWLSTILFGLFILSFYFVALLKGNTAQWNDILPGLYDMKTESATVGIGIHFAAGGIILILGCIQLVESIRVKYPALHRWLGRIYIIASLLTAIGGLVFIFVKGTIGGLIMDIGFVGYGVAMFVAAIETYRQARAKQLDKHRAWAIRLFALAIGSWLYRMDYGFWFLFTDGIGHTATFQGPFDYFMDFFFYLPNLLVAEVFIGRRKIMRTATAKWLAAAGLFITTAFLMLATYFFTKHYWGPAIIDLITG
jgi:uncharacterized membrane protein